MASSRREHLLVTAQKLFNKYGFHATGIDLVQAESGVSKTTMYKYFKSKDDLIQAVLERRHDQFNVWIKNRAEELSEKNYPGEEEARVLAMFDALTEWFQTDTFYGCYFINASAEYSEEDHPIHAYAAQHKLELVDLIRAQLPPMESELADELAKETLLLMDGAIVCANTTGMKDAGERAKKMFRLLLAQVRQQL
jgi:AcrR family transcriptional regulator